MIFEPNLLQEGDEDDSFQKMGEDKEETTKNEIDLYNPKIFEPEYLNFIDHCDRPKLIETIKKM